MKRLRQRLMIWIAEHFIFIDPCPIPTMRIWKVKVDNEIVYITSNNRIFAYLKAKIRHPQAKRIQVLTPLN